MKCPFCIKKCTKCGEILVAWSENFNKAKKGKWGLQSQCKKCNKQYREEHKEEILEKSKQYREEHKEYYKQYREEHKEEIAEYKKQYYEEHKEDYKQYREEHKEEIAEYKKQYYEEYKEQILEKNKQYREEHKEEILEKSKQYYEEHKEDILEYYKQWYEENKERITEYQKQYYEGNKERKLEYQKQYREENPHVAFNSCVKRRQLEENQGRGVAKEQWYEMMEYFDWKCAYSDTPLTKDNRSIDHIIPINNGGEHEIWNCVPMYKTYNISKHANDMENWYRQQPYFSEERLNKIYAWCEYAYKKWGYELEENIL